MQRPEFQPKALLATLVAHEVDFVVIGGFAGMALGSAYPSYDLDIAYERSPQNLERLAAALREVEATLRGAPEGLPFLVDARTLANGANFTFATPYGAFDILAQPDGAPPYAELARSAIPARIEGLTVRIASLDHLIAMKEAAGRPKDLLMASEYRALSDELRRPRS